MDDQVKNHRGQLNMNQESKNSPEGQNDETDDSNHHQVSINLGNDAQNKTFDKSLCLDGVNSLVGMQIESDYTVRPWRIRPKTPFIPKSNSHTVQLALTELASDYLEAIERYSPATTHQSHRQTIARFLNWSGTNYIELQQVPHEVTEFVRTLTGSESYSFDTVRGDVCTLSNLLAYLYRQDPELLSLRLVAGLRSRTNTMRKLRQQILGRFLTETSPSGTSISTIENTIDYLKQAQYGKRTHAYVELLFDARSRPEPVRALDLADINLREKTVRIDVPDTHLVGSVGLVENREMRLTESSVSAVRWYLERERACNPTEDSGPVFVTSHGRASSSTVRRSLQQASRTVSESNSNGQETSSGNEPSATAAGREVVPTDVWWYAIRSVIGRA